MTFDLKISAKARFRLTAILVGLSLLLSIGNFVATNTTIGPLYPFFHWKLYAQPHGWQNQYTEYRIYARDSLNIHFRRLPVRATFNYTIDEYFDIFNYLTSNVLKDPVAIKDYKKLFIFLKEVEPGYANYKIVEEKYRPLELIKNTSLYDTTTVITF